MSTPPLRVIWMSYAAAGAFRAAVPYVMVQIASPFDTHPGLLDDPHRVASLKVKFHDFHQVPHDATHQTMAELAHYMYDRKTACSVVDLVREHRQRISLVAVHCEAGISRSAAMAAALAEIFRAERRDRVDPFVQAVPNPLVYGLTLWAGRYRFTRQPKRQRIFPAPETRFP